MVSWANEITRKDMEEIYELTYKYQMLQQEARYGDQGLPQQLSDRAYIELARVSNELSNKLEDSYYRMLDVYERWVDHHVGLAETSVAEDLLSLVTTYEDLLGYVSQDTLRGIVAEEAAKAIERYRKNELIDSSYYDGLDLDSMSLADLLALPIVRNDTDLFMSVRKAVMNASDSLTEEREQKLSEYSEDTALGGAVSMLDRLRTEWQPLPEGLDQDIILIQEALTTAHNNGSMAQYLITQQGQIDPGAVEFLNGLSAGPQVTEWNRELSQLLGYPLGSRSAPTQEWYLAHLKRAMQRIADYEDMEGLKAYLTMGPVGEGRDLAVNFTTDFLEYLEQAGAEEAAAKVREELERNEFLDWDVLEGIPDALFKGFRQNLPVSLFEDAQTPTYLHLEYRRDVEDEWLIHGTNQARAVEQEGFTHGVWDYATLGLTTWFKDEVKTGGFNFAFYAENFHESEVLAYGKEAVIFQASGIEVFHHGDQQRQIIFWGSSAHDIHGIYRSSYGDFYASLGEEEFTGDMKECVSWLLERI